MTRKIAREGRERAKTLENVIINCWSDQFCFLCFFVFFFSFISLIGRGVVSVDVWNLSAVNCGCDVENENYFRHDKFKCWFEIFCSASPLEFVIILFLLLASSRLSLSSQRGHTQTINREKKKKRSNSKRCTRLIWIDRRRSNWLRGRGRTEAHNGDRKMQNELKIFKLCILVSMSLLHDKLNNFNSLIPLVSDLVCSFFLNTADGHMWERTPNQHKRKLQPRDGIAWKSRARRRREVKREEREKKIYRI